MHRFLSPPWVDAVRAVREEYAAHLDQQVRALDAPEVAINLVITDVPDAEGTVHAHAAVAGGQTSLDLGHLEDPAVVITIDYDTARAAVVEQNLQAIARAFLMGKIVIAGDPSALLGADGTDPTALLAALDLSGSTTFGDVDPVAAEVGARIRALTA